MIGILNSGIGGTLIEKEVRRLLPGVEVHYLRDAEHFPYGSKDPDEVVRIVDENCGVLVAQGARLIVLACKSASVVSLSYLRGKHRVPFVGSCQRSSRPRNSPGRRRWPSSGRS